MFQKELDFIQHKIEEYLSEGKKIFATSSFQPHSIPMLHILSQIDNSIPIYYINTGFHFPESLIYRDKVVEQLGLNLVDLHSSIPKNMQRDSSGNFYFTSDPDYCCFLNKTQPMDKVLPHFDIWINGIRKDQNVNRRNMQFEQETKFDVTRFHPMLEWSSRMIYQYIYSYKLPDHPLEAKGYLSIGCEPCTRKFNASESRDGRWFGMNKTECGLHTDLATK